ncbi:MAG: DUF1588 domain-containing protein [Myxococcales bacterium]|nr:DUF1588 domain-containing protein [Myxococcales bacterium]
MIWLTLFAACNTNGVKSILKQSECPPELDVFTEHVWEPVLSGQCVACHAENGVAEESGLRLDPNDLTATMASTIQVAERLAAKPSGTHPDGHGGGRVVQVGSDEHRALLFWKDWVGGTCELPQPRSCGEEEPAERLLRRLTHAEYDRTVSDLLGFDVRAGEKFASDPVVDGFRNDAHALVVGDLLADQYASSAESLAAAVDVRSLVDCDPGAEGEGTCAAVFVEDFGFRAFRRPLTVADIERYVGLWSDVAAAEGYEEGLRWVVIAMLQSPHFLYRPELGVQVEPGLFQLTDWEMASALSYALWGTMPDAVLFEAAADDALSSPDDIDAQIARMVGGVDGAPLDDRLADRAVGFLDAWLDLGQLSTVSREGLTPELRESLRRETETLMRDLVGEDAGLSDLMGARHTTLDPLLAEHYGLGQTGLVELDGERYGGLLTQGSVLTTFARPTGSSPVHRGVLVRERLLCEHLPPPPSNLDTSPPEVDPNLSTRERYSQHGSDPECAVCHDAIDPLGFAFEHYDQLGR